MKFIVGLIVTLSCVFGGYVLSHGKLAALVQPFELLIIAGGATGAFIIANPKTVIADVGKGVKDLFKSTAYDKAMYMDLLTLMFRLFSKARKDGLMALETEDFDLGQLKWVILMVLFNQPGEEAAYAWVEDLVFDTMASGLH